MLEDDLMRRDLGTTFAAVLLEGTDPGMEGLKEALDGEDALGIVVRCHLYLESALNELLRYVIPRYETMDRLPFSRKVALAYELTLIDQQLKSGLRALAALRNKYSHQIKYTISEDDIARVCNGLPRWAALLSHSTMESYLGSATRNGDSRLALAVLAMRARLLAIKGFLSVDLSKATKKAQQNAAIREQKIEYRVQQTLDMFKLYGDRRGASDDLL